MNQPQRTSLMPVIVGFALAASLLFLLGWLANRSRNAGPPVTPQVVLISPAADTIVGDSVTLVFTTSIPIVLQQTGWGAGRYHLHTLVNTLELMPGAADIKPAGSSRYTWTVPIRDSVATIHMLWALPNHSRLPDGGSDTITVRSNVTTPLPPQVPHVTEHGNH